MSILRVKFMYGLYTEQVRSRYGGSPCHAKVVKNDEIGLFILQNVSFSGILIRNRV